VLAERWQDIVWDMPGAQFAWAADTYLNAQKNVVPSLVEGWERLGWILHIEGKYPRRCGH